MRLTFSKLEALGNDFVLIDARSAPMRPGPEEVRQLGDRRRGIGFDQLLVLEAVETDSDTLCQVAIHNQDGSRAEQCGNGMRAVACWLADRGELKPDTAVLTDGGRVELNAAEDGQFSASLPPPRFEPEAVGHAGPSAWAGDDAGLRQQFIAVSMGNPHLVIFDTLGPSPERLNALGQHYSPPGFWPAGANVNLARVTAPRSIDLAVFERGVGPTPACGSGACATAAAAIRLGLAESPLTIHQPGGALVIDWQSGAHAITMTGPARHVFDGHFHD
ncbi:MAG: diaminopimelate epimerase [Wenzhouxiangella sp.]